MKFGHVVFEIHERTDRHTDMLIAILSCTRNLDVIEFSKNAIKHVALVSILGVKRLERVVCNVD